jgi:hypothetical protein
VRDFRPAVLVSTTEKGPIQKNGWGLFLKKKKTLRVEENP